jgi:hypothetical protein
VTSGKIAHGRSGQAFANLGAIAGLSYLAALVWLRWRSSAALSGRSGAQRPQRRSAAAAGESG